MRPAAVGSASSGSVVAIPGMPVALTQSHPLRSRVTTVRSILMNNNIRVFLWLGLVLAVWLNYNAWVVDYGPTGKVAGADTTRDSAANETKTGSLETSVPQATQSASANSAAVGDTPAAVPSVATGDPATTATATGPGLVRVRTDVLDVEISLAGGELRGAELLRYPVVKGGAERVELFNRDSPQTLYVLQTGFSRPPRKSSAWPPAPRSCACR